MAKEKWLKIISYVVFPTILLLYPLIHYNIGVDITDTGYSLGGFLFPNQMGEEWVTFSLYLSNAVGRLLTKLPFGHTMMGMNLYTGLFVSVTALLAYFFFMKKVPSWIAFLGEFMAISLCWCPTVILYNYLTYFFFTAMVILLYEGLVRDKKLFLFLAGIILALSVLTRFPNITQAALILTVWYYGWLHRKKIILVLQDTLLCVYGFLAGAGGILLVLLARKELNAYAAMIGSLFSMGTDGGSGHSLGDMLTAIVNAYLTGGKWLLYIVLPMLAGLLFFALFKDKFVRLKQGIYLCGILVLFRFLYGRGMYNFNYHEIYGAVFQWCVVFLMLALAINGFVVCSKHFEKREKLLASMLLLIIFVTPLGSDNYLNQNINNLFLVAPLTFWWMWRFLHQKEEWKIGKYKINGYAVKAMLAMVVAITFLQSTGFGFTFVFRDGKLGEKRNIRIENNDVLRGMYTSKEKAEAIESITEYCTKHQLIGRGVVLYGSIPAMSPFLHMPSALSTTYADMSSYTIAVMEKDMAVIKESIENGERPVIILNSEMGAWLSKDKQRMDYFGVLQDQYDEDEKLKLVQKLMLDDNYKETFANSKFVIFE